MHLNGWEIPTAHECVRVEKSHFGGHELDDCRQLYGLVLPSCLSIFTDITEYKHSSLPEVSRELQYIKVVKI